MGSSRLVVTPILEKKAPPPDHGKIPHPARACRVRTELTQSRVCFGTKLWWVKSRMVLNHRTIKVKN